MSVITRKGDIKVELAPCIQAYHQEGIKKCWEEFDQRILHAKVKFPLLEYCAGVLYEELSSEEQIKFCDWVSAGQSEGGNVILGIMLQKRMLDDFEHSVDKACEYITSGAAWYVSDLIGERLWGVSLLNGPGKTLKKLHQLSVHSSHWVVRSLGAGAHYSIKKGLPKKHVREVFKFLLSLANNKNYEIRRGIGWAAKTAGKFHPDIIAEFNKEIEDKEKVANWFRNKVNMGLKRNAYAQGN